MLRPPSDVPDAAHIPAGCRMGATAEAGVVDSRRVFGYRNLVIDGSVVSANLGVNPSLTHSARVLTTPRCCGRN